MKKGEFRRTSNRHDYALKPYGRTALNALKDAGYDVVSIGKIYDIFDGEGPTQSNHSNSSVHGMEQTIQYRENGFQRALFCESGGILTPCGDTAAIRKGTAGWSGLMRSWESYFPSGGGRSSDSHRGPRKRPHLYRHGPHQGTGAVHRLFSSMEGGKDLGSADTFAVIIGATVADNFG